MSVRHPVIAITGSSGAGTSTIRDAFAEIFLREKIHAAFISGDSFLRHDRKAMLEAIKTANLKGKPISHFGPDVNRFDLLESFLKEYGESGTGLIRQYVQEDTVDQHQQSAGTFTSEAELPVDTDLLIYEGLHGGVVANTWTRRSMSSSHNPVVIERRKSTKSKGVDVAQHVDFLIGVVPVVNLEWIQKIHRDKQVKGIPIEETTTTILRRLQDYIYFMTPQFSLTDINFQRVPLVDTSNPFTSVDVPTAAESMLIVRFREPEKFDLHHYLEKFDNSFMSRPNTLVIPGGKLRMALEVICTQRIQELVNASKQA